MLTHADIKSNSQITFSTNFIGYFIDPFNQRPNDCQNYLFPNKGKMQCTRSQSAKDTKLSQKVHLYTNYS